MINLFLDDERNPEDVTWIRYPSTNWVIVRDHVEFFKKLDGNVINRVSFDNDLGGTVEGVHIVHRLINQDIDEDILHQDIEWFIHSKNNIAVGRMTNLIENYWNHKFGTKPKLYTWIMK